MSDPLRSSTVLIVDDVASNIDMLYMMLEPFGVQVAAATCGEKALKLMPALLPDLILMDIMMPGIDGIETCRRLKGMGPLADIPVVFVTANPEEVQRAFEVGGVDYILKPFNRDEVLVRLRRHLEYSRRYARLESIVLDRTRELERANLHLKRMNQMKSRFLTMISHELRTPLTGIQGVTELLHGSAEGGGRRELLDVLRDSVARLDELMGDLFDLAALETGGFELSCHDFSLPDLLRYEVNLMNEKLGQRIQFSLADDMPARVSGDVTRIGQLLRRLVSGMLGLLPDGRLGLVVDCTEQAAATALVRFELLDLDGRIPADMRARLVAALENQDVSLSHLRDGLGMNLPVAALTTEFLNGGMSVADAGENFAMVAEFEVGVPRVLENRRRTAPT